MALTPRDHRITLKAAAALTRSHRNGPGKGGDRAVAFHADQVRELLAQKGCVALRIYHGAQEDGRTAMILVGVDGNDKEMTDGILLEFGIPCPPFCNDDSELNA